MLSNYRKNCYLHQKQILLVLSLVTLIFSTPTFATRIVNLDEIINLSNQMRNKDIVKKNGQADFATLSATLTKYFSEFNKRRKLIAEIKPQVENIMAKIKEYGSIQVIKLTTKNIKYRNMLGHFAINPKRSANFLKNIVLNPKADAMALKFVVKNIKTDDSARVAIVQQIETPAITLTCIAKDKETSNSTLKLIINHPKVDSNTLRAVAQHPIASKDPNILVTIINHPKVDIYTLLVIAQYPYSSEDKCKNTVTQLYLDYNIVEATEAFLSNLVLNKDITVESEIFTSIAKLKQFNDYDLIKLKSIVANTPLISQKHITFLIRNKCMLKAANTYPVLLEPFADLKPDQLEGFSAYCDQLKAEQLPTEKFTVLKLTDEEIIKKLQEECEIIKGANVCCEQSPSIEKDRAAVAFKWYEKAASQGSANAQYRLGVCYEDGIGVKRDEKMALEWYRKAASQGNADASYRLGVCYEQGPKTAFLWHRKGNNPRIYRDQYYLDVRSRQGLSVEPDQNMAIEWYKLAASHEHADAQYCLGVCYMQGLGISQDKKKAVEWYEKAANNRHAEALYQLGVCYDCGYGVNKNTRMAIKWYGVAASYGHTESQFLLYGNATGRHESDDMELLRHPRTFCQPSAQRQIGFNYQHGENGVVKDEKTAVLWYTRAASAPCYIRIQTIPLQEQTPEKEWENSIQKEWENSIKKDVKTGKIEKDAYVFLYNKNKQCLYCTRLVNEVVTGIIDEYQEVKSKKSLNDIIQSLNITTNDENIKLNLQQMKLLSQQIKDIPDGNGNADAQYLLGVCYEEGRGVKKDIKMAIEWYNKSVNNNNNKVEKLEIKFRVDVTKRLEALREEGLRIEKEEKRVLEWYEKAASQKDAAALYQLGVCYEQGLFGAEKNETAAIAQYKLAASYGHVEVCYRLGVYYEQDLSAKKDGKVVGDPEYDGNEEQRIRLLLLEEIKKVEQKYEKVNNKQIIADQQGEKKIALTQNTSAPILITQTNEGVSFNTEELKKAHAINVMQRAQLTVNSDEENENELSANKDANKAFIFDSSDEDQDEFSASV